MQFRNSSRLLALTTALTASLSGSALASGAGTAATGIAAGLGLTAATGKTTVSSGAGGIEASLLTADAVLAAGQEIRNRAATAANGKPVLVLGRSDVVDLASARWVSDRIDTLQHEVSQATCADSAPGGGPHIKSFLLPQPSAADIGAALATDVTISQITISEDDRLLINAVASLGVDSASAWVPLGAPAPARSSSPGIFVVPGEVVDTDSTSDLMKRYRTLQSSVDHLAACPSASAKAAISSVSDFVKGVSTSSKGPAPIVLAALLVNPDRANPLILRVAIEQVGGTAITRNNIWYSLGFPGAATISSGLLASYRLTDPINGQVVARGLVRCVIKPVNFSDVDAALSAPTKQICRVAPA